MSAADRDRREAEELLRWLAEVEEEGAGDLPDERLTAYREGRVEPAAAAEIEVRLAADPGARERLAALAGVRLPEPTQATREAVLAGFAVGRPVERRERVGRVGQRFARRTFRWLAAVAALLLLAFATWRLVDRWAPPPVPEYRATIAGLAEQRAAPPSGGRARAFPDTVVRIEATPRDRAKAGIDLGLYREAGGGLERIEDASLRRLSAGRGAVVFEARAAELVATSAPGSHRLYLVAAPAGRLPRRVDLDPGEHPIAALAGRRVISLEIEMLAAP